MAKHSPFYEFTIEDTRIEEENWKRWNAKHYKGHNNYRLIAGYVVADIKDYKLMLQRIKENNKTT